MLFDDVSHYVRLMLPPTLAPGLDPGARVGGNGARSASLTVKINCFEEHQETYLQFDCLYLYGPL